MFALPLDFALFLYHASPPPDIYTLSLHDALPICNSGRPLKVWTRQGLTHHSTSPRVARITSSGDVRPARSEEHTSELQSHSDIVCRLLLEKKKLRTCIYKLTRKCIWMHAHPVILS